MKVYRDLFDQIIAIENLFIAWGEFRRGKTSKVDVLDFERRLEENIFTLQRDLAAGRYKHGPYHAFYITDPKQRLIHKALVRDRILHHAIFKVLNPLFEPTFIANSFSCRDGKGTHKGVRALSKMLRQVSRNNTAPCWVLKCDVHKFFASMDHQILLGILQQRIDDPLTMELLSRVISSFNTSGHPDKGLPIGNLTSQLFANVYMNELDQFIKHQLRAWQYIRYTDDFVIADKDKLYSIVCYHRSNFFYPRSLNYNSIPTKLSSENTQRA